MENISESFQHYLYHNFSLIPTNSPAHILCSPGESDGVPKMFWWFYILKGMLNTYTIDATCQTLGNSK